MAEATVSRRMLADILADCPAVGTARTGMKHAESHGCGGISSR
jgi:hypothetical protein